MNGVEIYLIWNEHYLEGHIILAGTHHEILEGFKVLFLT
jgi:hypothetical protein